MKKIAIFIDTYSIDYSPSIINMLDYLSEEFQIDLFIKNVFYKRSQVLRKKNVTVIEIRPGLNLQWLWNDLLYRVKEIIKYLIRKNLKIIFSIGKRLTREEIRGRMSARAYVTQIAFEPRGLILCQELFPESKPIYYSLELYLLSDPLITDHAEKSKIEIKRLMEKERRHVHDISGLIIQSPEKENLFRRDYGLADAIPSLILPVTCRGKAVVEKSNYLRQAFHIPDDKKIALHLGGMNFWFSCIEMAQTFARFDDWVLVFQGNHYREYLHLFQKKVKAGKMENIIVLKKFFTEIDSLNHILMSCDVGIAWYNNISLNFSTAGQSSGKIATYLKFGLPVVANRYPSTEEVLINHGCGICVDSMSEITAALGKISENYAFFSANARQEYERLYRFENYHQSIQDFLNF